MSTDFLLGFDPTEKTKTMLKMPALPEIGKSYSLVPLPGGKWGWGEAYSPPPIDTFVEGWIAYPWSQLIPILSLGTPHVAVSFGQPTGFTVGPVTFERSNNNGADITVPGAGWSGTNWAISRNNATFNPTIGGSNNGRTEVTPWPDGPDPSLGDTAGVDTLCQVTMRRNALYEFSNLTVGNRYYLLFMYWGYPATTSLTKLQAYDGTTTASPKGIAELFAMDGPGLALSQGIRRFGFIATDTTMTVSKICPDNNGSYSAGMACLDMGTP